MKATFTKRSGGKFNPNFRKDNGFSGSFELLAVYKGQLVEIGSLRTYSPGTVSYACLWIYDRKTDTHVSGTGNAGGYGYHKRSAAADEAIDNAGIVLSRRIDGAGDNAIKNALHAIGKALGYRKTYVIDVYP